MKFLVFREEGIGNCLLTTPMLQVLRRRFPDAQIDVMVSDRGYGVLKDNPFIDSLILFNQPIVEDYDYGIDAPFTCGVYAKMAKDRCKKLLNIKQDYTNMSEADHCLEIIKNEFDAQDDELTHQSIYISREDWIFARETLRYIFNPICVCTGCYINLQDGKDVWRNRRWFNEYWIELFKTLKTEYGVTPVLLGGENEIKDAHEMLSECEFAVSLLTKTSIKQAAAIIALSRLFISIDCGLMHVAAAVRARQIALFGSTSELKSAPQQNAEKIEILRDYDLKCKSCYTMNKNAFFTCDDRKCMKNIKPGQVLETIRRRKWL